MTEVHATQTASGAAADSEQSSTKTRAQKRDKLKAAAKSSAPTSAVMPPTKDQANGPNAVSSVAEFAKIVRREPEGRKKRLKMAEALRERGLDEYKLAATCEGLIEKLSGSDDSGAVGVAAAKLLLEVLKEIMHVLEPPKSAGGGDAREAPPFVRLIHSVPRPVRTE